MLKTHNFICLSFLLIFTDHARCAPDYVFNLRAGGWLKLYSMPEPWEEAYLRCHRDGAVLASPLKKGLLNALQLQMAQFGLNSHIFIGTHDLYSKGNYVSVEGVPLSDMYIKWDSHDNRVNNGDCLTMSVDGFVHYSSCKDALPFICYKKIISQKMNECGTFDNEYHLNQQTGSCYKIHLEKMPWSHAYSICASEGGHLVILNDEEEAKIVRGMFPVATDINNPWAGFHVGLGVWGKERIWTTIHGERIDRVFNEWHINEPNNANGIQVRGALLLSGKLDDIRKDTEPQMFACEKSPKLEQSEDFSQYNMSM